MGLPPLKKVVLPPSLHSAQRESWLWLARASTARRYASGPCCGVGLLVFTVFGDGRVVADPRSCAALAHFSTPGAPQMQPSVDLEG